MKLRNLVLASSILIAAGLVVAAYAQKTGDVRSASSKVSKGEREPDGARVLRARANWFYSQRAYPLKRIPAFARERAWQAFRQMQQSQRQYLQQKYGTNYKRLSAAAALAAAAVNTSASWASIGPKPTNDFFFQPYVSGRVTALVVDPCDSTGNTVFLGGAQGGLWKTTNGGASWTPLNDSAPSLAVGSLAVPPSPTCVGTPSTSNTVYVGTGEENFSFDSYYGAGVLKCATTDGVTYACTPDNTLGAFNASAPLTQDSGGPFIGSLAIDPQNPQIMLAAVQGFSSTLPSGIWCSADAGSTWSHVLPNVTRVVGTGVAFDQAGFAYAALGNIDGGTATGNTTVNGVYMSSAALTTACSPGFTQLGALASLISGGASSMGRIAISAFSSSTSSSTSDILYAAIARAADTSGTLLGVFKSTNGGSSWSQLTAQLVNNANGFCNDQCFYDLTITIDPHNSNVVYAGGSAPGSGSNGEGNTIIASTDGGSTWTDISSNSCSTCNSGVHVDAHAIAFAPAGSSGAATKVYVGTDGGSWNNATPESPTSTQVWVNLNQSLALTQIYPGVSNNPAGWQFRSFLGAQDNGMQVFGQQSVPTLPLSWDDTLACGDGGVTLVDPLIPSTMYGECAYIPGFYIGGINKSLMNGNADNVNGANTFAKADFGIDFNDDGNFIPPLAIDPEATGSTGDAQTLYFGTYRVWQSTTGAALWNSISPDVTGAASSNSTVASQCSSNPGFCVLTALAVSPTDSNEVATGSNVGEVYLSQNAGQGSNATWTDVTALPLPLRAVTHVAIDPASANTVYATFSGFSGFNGDNAGHVFIGNIVSGTTPSVLWTDISSGAACASPAGNLPNIPANDIVVDPDHAGQLFVATDVGVFMGTLQGTPPAVTGACWQPLGSGLPNSAVLSLSLNEASRTLIAGTHGRSAWALALGDQPAFSLGGLSPASSDAGSAQFTMTLTGTGFTASSTVNWTPQGGSATSLAQTTPPSGCATPTCIAVQVPATLVASGSLAQVSVTDSGNTTNSLTFTVTSAKPTLTNVTPQTASAPASSNLTLSLTGTNFISTTTPGLAQLAAFPSNCFSTSNVTSTSLTATVQSSCLQYGGIFFVTAANPPPGGGSSNPNLLAFDPNTGNPICCLLHVTGPVPSNDNFGAANAITSSSFSTTEDTSSATADGAPIPTSCTSGAANNGDANSVWFKFTPSANTTAEFDTIGSAYDTILSVWTGASTTTLANVACNDDIVTGIDRVSQISNLNLNGGTTYYIMVSAYGLPTSSTTIIGDGGKLVFNMTAGPAPNLSFTSSASAPNPATITAGSSSSATLTLTPQSGSSTGTVSVQPCTTSPSTSTITCSYSTSSISLGTSPATTTVTINTVARGALPPALPFRSPPLGWLVAFLAAASLFVFFLRRRSFARGPVPVRSGILAALGFALLAGMLIFEGACGGGTPSSGGTTGTPAGNYTVTVPTSPAATNGNASVQLTVN
ncbi:MAG: hypothetical protein KGL59_05830 [Acidobacteriota bacterium]|nr:hypothetical protein [Acidobacteriota bacterium]